MAVRLRLHLRLPRGTPLLLLLLLLLLMRVGCGHAQTRRVHIPDDLDDVVDSEEDEEWRAWGRPRELTVPKGAFDEATSTLNMGGMHDFTAAKLKGPAQGHVKLRPDPRRPEDGSKLLAYQWTNLLKSGYIKGGFRAVDPMTIWFEVEDDRTIPELQNFIFQHEEAYEFKIADSMFRRPGDETLSRILGRNVWKNEDKARAKVMMKMRQKQAHKPVNVHGRAEDSRPEL